MKRPSTLSTFAWTFTALIGPVFLVLLVENWTGESALAETKRQLYRTGETLDLAKLQPSPVPEVENFCAIPPLAGITLGDENQEQHKALRKLTWGYVSGKTSPKLSGGCEMARPFDFPGALSYLRDGGYLDVQADASPKQALAAIDRLHPLLKVLSDAAVDRTEAVLFPAWGTGHGGPPAHWPLPHLNSIMPAVNGLALRSQIATAAGDGENAVRSLLATMRLTEAMGSNPTLIELFVATGFSTYELNSLWSLLHQHATTETQLAAIQQGLERQDFMAYSLQALRGELALQIANIEWYKQHPDKRLEMYHYINFPSVKTEVPWWKELLARGAPAGLFDHNAATLIQLYSTGMLEPCKTEDVSRMMHSFEELDRLLPRRQGMSSTHHLLAISSLPSAWRIVQTAVYAEAVRRQGVIAVAVERYRLAHGKLPAAPAEMVPEFLKAVPNDPMDREAMRYRADGEGFTLWSVAIDRQDDGGKLPSEKEARKLYFDHYKGDWVWKSCK